VWGCARAGGRDLSVDQYMRNYYLHRKLLFTQVDEILVWIKDALLSLEALAVDQTEHNLRIMLDLGVANVLLMCC
jgi:hypothetical protein